MMKGVCGGKESNGIAGSGLHDWVTGWEGEISPGVVIEMAVRGGGDDGGGMGWIGV